MTISIRDEGAVRIVTIERPAVRNAVDGPTARLLYDAFVEFDLDDSVAVAVLTGADGTFCAGADLGAIAAGRGNHVGSEPADAIVGSIGPMGPTRLLLDKPVIAAVEGFAVAGGIELACWADLRVAAADATFGVYCRRWGVPLIDGGTIRLPRLIGHVARSRPDPDGPGDRRGRGRTHRTGEPGGAERRGAGGRGRPGRRDRRAAPDLPALRPAVGLRPGRPIARRRARQRGGGRSGDDRVRRDRRGCPTVHLGCRPPRRIRLSHEPTVRMSVRSLIASTARSVR